MYRIIKTSHIHFQSEFMWMFSSDYLILISITTTILDIIRSAVFYLKHNVSETGFCPWR
jgi:hypothetical protein